MKFRRFYLYLLAVVTKSTLNVVICHQLSLARCVVVDGAECSVEGLQLQRGF